MNTELTPLNPANFLKVAHGDLGGLRTLTFDSFNDTWRRMTGWLALIESGNFNPRPDELRRRKGGVALIGSYESPAALEERGFDLAAFETELTAEASAVLAMTA